MNIHKAIPLILSRGAFVATGAAIAAIAVVGTYDASVSAADTGSKVTSVAVAPWPPERPNPMCIGPFC